MSKTDYKNNSEYKSFLRIVYAICVFLVLYFILGVFLNRASGVTSAEDPRLMSYEEMKNCENNLQIPQEWRFMAKKKADPQRRRLFPKMSQEEIQALVLRQKQVTEDVANLAESLRERNEALSNQPVAPLLKLGVMRKHPNQTYEPADLGELTALGETSDSDSEQGTIIRHTLAKPTSMEPELLPGDEEVSTIETPPQNPEQKTENREASVSGQAFETPDLTANSRKVSPLPAASPQSSANVYPRLQNKVRISKKGQDSAEELLKYFDDVPEEGAVPDQAEVEIEDQAQRPYNREEGMEILRKFNRIARERLESYSRDVHDYALFLYKWDTTNSRSDGMDVMYIKLREKPYSIYSFTFLPKRSEGREMLYWDGHYDGRLLVNSGPNLWNRTLLFRPDSSAIQNHSTRSVLHLGFRRLLEELIEISSRADAFRDAEIRYYDEAKVGTRACYALEVTFPKKTPEQDFYQIRIFVDRELTLPIQIVIYDWPEKGKSPKVLESYTYVIQQMNVGFQDRDFCHLNPQYGFNSYVPDLSEREAEFMKEIIPPEERKAKKN